jgi:hypothetical protein
VADRWHLVHNLADALERFAVRVLAALRTERRTRDRALVPHDATEAASRSNSLRASARGSEVPYATRADARLGRVVGNRNGCSAVEQPIQVRSPIDTATGSHVMYMWP